MHDRSIITPFSVMSDPHISAGGSSEDIKKDNIPPTSSNSLLGALSLPGDAFCLHSIKDFEWELFWGDTGKWEKARKDLAVKIFYRQGK